MAELGFGEDHAPSPGIAAPDAGIKTSVGTLIQVLCTLDRVAGNDAILGGVINLSRREDALEEDELGEFGSVGHGEPCIASHSGCYDRDDPWGKALVAS